MAYFIPAPTAYSTLPALNTSYGPSAIEGYELSVTGTNEISLAPGTAMAENTNFQITYDGRQPLQNGTSIVINTSVVASKGVSGVYPVALSSLGLSDKTVFPVYVLGDSSGENPTIGVVATGNHFLVDFQSYDAFRRVGWVYIDDATLAVIPMTQSGSGYVRTYQLDNAVEVLNAGASQTAASVLLGDGDAPVPPGPTSEVILRASWTPAAAADTSSLTATGVTSTTYPVVLKNAAALEALSQVRMIPGVDSASGNAAVDYINSAAAGALTLHVSGWVDNLRLKVV